MTFKTNRRPNFKRNNNYASRGRSKGNVTQQYNKYLKLAKDTFSSGDRIQAEYYYQYTDHYYRLMLELGINLEDSEAPEEVKSISNENNNLDADKSNPELENLKIDTDENNLTDIDQSIESVPFISEPVKKKRSKTLK